MISRFGRETCATEIVCPLPPAGVAGAMMSVSGVVATAEPREFVAVTTTRIRWPTSAAATVYRLLVAPPIGPQLPPAVSQRCHTYENDFGAFVQLPLLAVRTEPSLADPEIEGRDVFAGTALD